MLQGPIGKTTWYGLGIITLFLLGLKVEEVVGPSLAKGVTQGRDFLIRNWGGIKGVWPGRERIFLDGTSHSPLFKEDFFYPLLRRRACYSLGKGG